MTINLIKDKNKVIFNLSPENRKYNWKVIWKMEFYSRSSGCWFNEYTYNNTGGTEMPFDWHFD